MVTADDVAAIPSWIIMPTSNNYGLCLCSQRLARDVDKLRQMGIGAVVTVAYEARDIVLPPDIKRLHIDMVDAEEEKIYAFFNTTFHFIDNNLQKTNVLVHCVAGVSRSPAIVLAYMMKKHKLTLRQAWIIVDSKRNYINPNVGFMKQLDKYQKELESERDACRIF